MHIMKTYTRAILGRQPRRLHPIINLRNFRLSCLSSASQEYSFTVSEHDLQNIKVCHMHIYHPFSPYIPPPQSHLPSPFPNPPSLKLRHQNSASIPSSPPNSQMPAVHVSKHPSKKASSTSMAIQLKDQLLSFTLGISSPAPSFLLLH